MENEKCLIVHEYKIRVNKEYYLVTFVGNKSLAENYFLNTWKVKEMYFKRSYIIKKEHALKLCMRNKKFDGGILLKLEYLHLWNGSNDNATTGIPHVENRHDGFFNKYNIKTDKNTHINDNYIYSDNLEELKEQEEESYE